MYCAFIYTVSLKRRCSRNAHRAPQKVELRWNKRQAIRDTHVTQVTILCCALCNWVDFHFAGALRFTILNYLLHKSIKYFRSRVVVYVSGRSRGVSYGDKFIFNTAPPQLNWEMLLFRSLQPATNAEPHIHTPPHRYRLSVLYFIMYNVKSLIFTVTYGKIVILFIFPMKKIFNSIKY